MRIVTLRNHHSAPGICQLVPQIFPFIGRVNRDMNSAQFVGGKPHQDRIDVAVEKAADGIAELNPSGCKAMRQLRSALVDLSERIFFSLKIQEDLLRLFLGRS